MHNRRIVVLTSHYLFKPTKESLSRLNLSCCTKVVAYDNFSHIGEVYDAYSEEADGFLVTGRSAHASIYMTARKAIKPTVSFQIGTASLYKALLQIFLENRDQDPQRIVLDALLPIEGGCTVDDFLRRSEVDSVDTEISRWFQQANMTVMGSVASSIFDQLLTLWNSGKIDMVLCQYSTIIPELEKHGIPYRYPIPNDYEVASSINELLVQIELDELRANLPAAVNIAPRHRTQVSSEQLAALKTQIELFFKEHFLECVIQDYQKSFSIPITTQSIRYFTQNFASCILSEYLNRHLDFPVSVGYGIGFTLTQSLSYAQSALREAIFSGGSYVKDEQGTLIGPLGAKAQMTIESCATSDIAKIAQDCQLSTMTIQKVLRNISMTGTNKFTTRELSERFGVTVRNAHRILSSLQKGGYAKCIYSQASSSKGRPVKVYEINLSVD